MTFVKHLLLLMACSLFVGVLATDVSAQQIRELTTDNVKPAFQVEPVVQRLQGRRGAPVDFEFKITSLLRTTNVEVRAVAMMQEESGAIMPDVDNPAPTEVQLASPAKIKLNEDAESVIRGSIRVPTTNSPFHVYGILVTDFGQDLPANGAEKPVDGSKVEIQFVTRYLLRIEIDVEGVRPTDAGQLLIEGAALQENNGYPQVDLFIQNPTESPIEFHVDCRLSSLADPVQGKSFPL